MEEKEKGKAFVDHVRQGHQVLSSGDEDEETGNKRKRGKLCLILRKGDDIEDGSTKLTKNYCFMEKEGNISIIEQVKFMMQSNNYSMHDYEPHLGKLTQTCDDVLSDYKKALD